MEALWLRVAVAFRRLPSISQFALYIRQRRHTSRPVSPQPRQHPLYIKINKFTVNQCTCIIVTDGSILGGKGI